MNRYSHQNFIIFEFIILSIKTFLRSSIYARQKSMAQFYILHEIINTSNQSARFGCSLRLAMIITHINLRRRVGTIAACNMNTRDPCFQGKTDPEVVGEREFVFVVVGW